MDRHNNTSGKMRHGNRQEQHLGREPPAYPREGTKELPPESPWLRAEKHRLCHGPVHQTNRASAGPEHLLFTLCEGQLGFALEGLEISFPHFVH